MHPRAGILLLLPLLGSCRAVSRGPTPVRTWIGMTMRFDTEARAIEVLDVMTDAPAWKAGLRRGDRIVVFDGTRVSDLPEDEVLIRFLGIVHGGPAGRRLTVIARRGKRTRPFFLILEPKPTILPPAGPIPPNEEILPGSFGPSPEERHVLALLDAVGRRKNFQDLLVRRNRLHHTPDPFRLRRIAFLTRDPFRLPALSRRAAAELSGPKNPFPAASRWLDRPIPPPPGPSAAGSIDGFLDNALRLFREARGLWRKAFEGLQEEEIDFLWNHHVEPGQALIESPHLQSDRNPGRLRGNVRWLRLAARVRFAELIRAASLLLSLIPDPERLRDRLLADWRRRGLGPDETIIRRTEFGDFVVAGPGRQWFREDAALILDLGGDDLYSNNAGGSRGPAMPFAIVVDLGGNDAYESTDPGTQGAGRLGVGILFDLEGDESYVVQQWGQGTCILGAGLLWDAEGDDRYRGREYVQGTALMGVGGIRDDGGDDRYRSPRYAQGLGLPGGFGFLLDGGGRDEYYCKGRYRTSFGDRGIFEGWGQGCGAGIRGVASGGIGLLLDESGPDRYESGNFSQGAGYAAGWGILIDRAGADRYIGSRYTQGAAAHQSLGFFEDCGGEDDLFEVRQGGSQAAAWDEAAAVLIDHGGNDRYSGGRFFSQGAAAHNGVSVFLDLGGRDLYDFLPGPGRPGPANYHGGTSLAVFLDAGGGKDRYRCGPSDDRIRYFEGDGFRIDLPGPLPPEPDPDQLRRLLR